MLDLRDGCIDLIGVILTGLLSEISVDDDVGAPTLVDEVLSTGTCFGASLAVEPRAQSWVTTAGA